MKKYTLEEANHYFAVEYNNSIWKMLEKNDKSEDDYNEIINRAHASLLHWSQDPNCKKVNIQRGEFMVAMAYLYAGRKEQALYHAKKCMEITGSYGNEMEDFDLAFAPLIMASALSLSGSKQEAKKYLLEANNFGERIAEEEDKKIFVGERDTFEKHFINTL